MLKVWGGHRSASQRDGGMSCQSQGSGGPPDPCQKRKARGGEPSGLLRHPRSRRSRPTPASAEALSLKLPDTSNMPPVTLRGLCKRVIKNSAATHAGWAAQRAPPTRRAGSRLVATPGLGTGRLDADATHARSIDGRGFWASGALRVVRMMEEHRCAKAAQACQLYTSMCCECVSARRESKTNMPSTAAQAAVEGDVAEERRWASRAANTCPLLRELGDAPGVHAGVLASRPCFFTCVRSRCPDVGGTPQVQGAFPDTT